jgi:hypothetical protein
MSYKRPDTGIKYEKNEARKKLLMERGWIYGPRQTTVRSHRRSEKSNDSVRSNPNLDLIILTRTEKAEKKERLDDRENCGALWRVPWCREAQCQVGRDVAGLEGG